jgi:endoglucanase
VKALVAAAIALLAVLGGCAASRAPAGPAAPAGPVTSVAVAGNQLVDQDGRAVVLRGVNRSGTQYVCTTAPETFDGPSDQASIDAMRAWGINAVRVSLNEQCWLGVNGLPVGRPAGDYRRDVTDFVSRLTASGLAVIVDLHWNAPGTNRALEQAPMADRDHAPAFWRSVAPAFAGNPAVLFDLYNEPYPDSERDTDAAWLCVRDGGQCPGVGFTAAGMQELVDAVRGTGARNTILVAGPQWAGSVDRWTAFAPVDPLGQLAASVHVYGPPPKTTDCADPTCWDSTVAPLAQRVPVVFGEIGNTNCSGEVVGPLMDFADRHAVSFLAWAHHRLRRHSHPLRRGAAEPPAAGVTARRRAAQTPTDVRTGSGRPLSAAASAASSTRRISRPRSPGVCGRAPE